MSAERSAVMLGKYELVCTEQRCNGRKIVTEAMSVGWAVGDIIKADKADPNAIRCPHCKRGKMRIAKIPKFEHEVPVKGFSKLPKE